MRSRFVLYWHARFFCQFRIHGMKRNVSAFVPEGMQPMEFYARGLRIYRYPKKTDAISLGLFCREGRMYNSEQRSCYNLMMRSTPFFARSMSFIGQRRVSEHFAFRSLLSGTVLHTGARESSRRHVICRRWWMPSRSLAVNLRDSSQ